MLTYSLENTNGDSIYEYLYKCIRNDILDKKLPSGEKLPSKRTFAKNHGISTITVEGAYAQLCAEGYIYSIPKKGYFVSDISDDFSKSKIAKPATKEHRDLNIFTDKADYFADFSVNSIAHELFPFSIWAKLLREVTASEDKSLLLHSPSTGGVSELKKAIAKHLYEFRGMSVNEEQIIIGAGTEYMYGLIIQLLGRNNIYGIEDPGYPRLGKIYESNDALIRHLKMDDSGVIPSFLEESDVNILHISPSHHYPTGISVPISRRYELLGWASANDSRYIIEDDYDCEFRLYGKPIPALQSIDVLGKVIYINTFSKSIAPAFRISYMVLPSDLAKKYHEKLGFYSCTVSAFEQYTLAEFIKRGYFEKHINRMRNYYRSKQNTIIQLLKQSEAAPYITIDHENEGLHFILRINQDISDESLKQNARSKGLNISCLSEYYKINKCCEHAIVLSYSGIDNEILPKAISLIAECIAKEITS